MTASTPKTVLKVVAPLLCMLMVHMMLSAMPARSQVTPWQQVASGLDLGRFKVTDQAVAGDSIITILRVDPTQWELRLLSISQTGDRTGLNAREWCEKYKLVAAINAGMFQLDQHTHVGYMKSGSHINSAKRNSYKSVAAFGPLRPGLPPFRICDLDVDRLDSVINRYANVVQNMRMINRASENRWAALAKEWSEAALGEDRQGRALFIFSRSPYPMHDLNRILLSLPIDLVCAQHLEGGPEAQLYFHWGEHELELVGSYETAFTEDNQNIIAWPVPNVIGIMHRMK